MFHCKSISHHHTPLEIREQLSLTATQQAAWLSQQHDLEVALLSTCNRLELYAHAPSDQHMQTLWADLLQQRDLTPPVLEDYTLSFVDFEAAEHLMRVSCGLESMALGEPQILGQVTHAYEQALDCNSIGGVLSVLFRAVIYAAKRARTETAIGNGSASVSSLGITKAEEACGNLADKNMLVLGAGEMGTTIVKSLVQREVHNITVVSRTLPRARRLADEWPVQAKSVTDLKDAITQADVLFTTSGAPYTILAGDDIAPIMQARPDRILCIIDIALPRDVDPEVADIPGVLLHDLDDLQHVIEENLAEREMNIPAVEQIIIEELALFWSDYQSRSVVPTIRKLREHAEQLRQSELTWAYNRLAPENQHERALFEQFSHRFMNKMLHQLTHNLKAKACEEDGVLVAAVARDLFGLEETWA